MRDEIAYVLECNATDTVMKRNSIVNDTNQIASNTLSGVIFPDLDDCGSISNNRIGVKRPQSLL